MMQINKLKISNYSFFGIGLVLISYIILSIESSLITNHFTLLTGAYKGLTFIYFFSLLGEEVTISYDGKTIFKSNGLLLLFITYVIGLILLFIIETSFFVNSFQKIMELVSGMFFAGVIRIILSSDTSKETFKDIQKERKHKKNNN